MKDGIKMRIVGIIALISIIVFTTTACSGKGGKAAPASDFNYDLTADGKGIKITYYMGNEVENSSFLLK